MFEITDINYKEDHIKINFDTGEAFYLTGDVFNMYSLSRGKLIDSTEYQQLKEESERYSCRQKALNYLSSRSRSSFEMNNYLIKKGFSKDIARETIEILKDKNYLNDYEYALAFISHKLKGKPAGKHLLEIELSKKGITREIIRKAINESGVKKADPDALYRLALKKYKSLENKKNKIPKLVYFLRQRGFEHEEIRTAVDRLNKEENVMHE